MIHLANSEKNSVQAVVRQHSVISDLLPESGGDDYGMNPHEILETALAACTSLTVQMYARRKNINVQDIKVEVSTVSEGAQTVISRKIELVGTFTVEEKKRLLEIADKCPIHKLLESHVTIQNESF